MIFVYISIFVYSINFVYIFYFGLLFQFSLIFSCLKVALFGKITPKFDILSKFFFISKMSLLKYDQKILDFVQCVWLDQTDPKGSILFRCCTRNLKSPCSHHLFDSNCFLPTSSATNHTRTVMQNIKKFHKIRIPKKSSIFD